LTSLAYIRNEKFGVVSWKEAMPSFVQSPNVMTSHLEWMLRDEKKFSGKLAKFDDYLGMFF